jgi:hypothetical protein
MTGVDEKAHKGMAGSAITDAMVIALTRPTLSDQ